MPILNPDQVGGRGGDGNALPLHFGAYTNDTITVSTDQNAPTYLTNIVLFPSSSPEFTLITDGSGVQWLRNDSTKTFSMQGTITYQTVQGAGGRADLKLWSERSDDNGTTFVENLFSLRNSEIRNNSNNSQTKSSGVDTWSPGESIRWAMYNAGPGEIILDGPTATVNGGNVVEGLTFYWQLNATT
ncbi:hypothetical protein VPBG_00021 [Vibrio phage helene 12B3]|uniref:hypothetical protein n=1 Tax=Vibrio phage helene 12B3 TaxID=573173 RepID=UPI0002C15C60|nr:hypothetical protein VPBG_00021 [Vibrio phage helene 12B3]YP_009222904.1 hypothetical protein VPLG_00055 [Vibrio phage eugene 12A10]AGG57794.1 hypothetical protein VPBG_00021 [Vibrio phage helene 12B3]AGN51494.1 hypothetical protein VPLG_00055 [Vibrio phage eugene 12A10]